MLGKWFDYQAIPLNLDLSSKNETLNEHHCEKLYNFARKIYEQEVFKVEIGCRKKDSDGKYLFKLIHSGTHGDKISALVLLIQKSPLHSLSYLRSLNGLIKKINRKISIMVIEVMRELFLTELLPSNRKLRKFQDQPYLSLLYEYLNQNSHYFDNNTGDDKINQLKKAKNNIEKSVNNKADLLTSSQFSQLLMMYYFEHTLKQEIYPNYIQHLKVFSHDQLDVTKFLAIQTMQELLIHKPEGEGEFLIALINKLGDPKPKISNRICNLLKEIVHKHPNMRIAILQEIESLLFLRANNINTQAPFYATVFIKSCIIFDKHKDSALALKVIKIFFGLFKVLLKQKDMPLRLMASIFNGINKAFPYLSHKDYSYEEILKEINIFYEIYNKVNFNTSLEILAFLYQFLFNPQALIEENLKDRFYKCLYKKILDPELKTSIKQDKFFALLFKAMSQDHNLERTKAILKRLLGLCLSSPVPFVIASLIIMSEVGKSRKDLDLAEVLNNPSSTTLDEDCVEAAEPLLEDIPNADSKAYDFLARDPRYSGNIRGFYELRPFNQHFHPTVSLYVRDLLNGSAVQYDGDPMKNFAFSNFIENFTHKNPKNITRKTDRDEKDFHPAHNVPTKNRKDKSLYSALKKLHYDNSDVTNGSNSKFLSGNKSIGNIDFAQDYSTEKEVGEKRKYKNKVEERKQRKAQKSKNST